MYPEEKVPKMDFFPFIMAYYFSNGTDFWAPYPDLHYGITLSNFGKNKNRKIQYLENVTNIEEFLHRRLMIATKTRFEIAWEETLSLCELSILLKEVKNKDSQLLVPIQCNLNVSQIPNAIKNKIKNLIKADKLLKTYIHATAPFIESSTLVYLEKLFSEIKKPLFKKRLQRQFNSYAFLEKIYPIVKMAMNNYSIEIPLASIVLSTRLPRYKPSLTLQESLKHFSMKNARQIQHRFNRLIHRLAKVSVSSETEFSRLVEDLGFEYLNADDIFGWLIPSYQNAIDTLSSTFEEYIFAPINTPLNLALDKILEFEKTKENVLKEMDKKKEDMQSGIFLADTLYAGTSSIQLLENSDHTIRNLGFNPGVSIELRKEITQAAIMMFFLRVFVLNEIRDCPFSGHFEECRKCILRDRIMKEFRSKIEINSVCPAHKMLNEMNIKIVSSQ